MAYLFFNNLETLQDTELAGGEGCDHRGVDASRARHGRRDGLRYVTLANSRLGRRTPDALARQLRRLSANRGDEKSAHQTRADAPRV